MAVTYNVLVVDDEPAQRQLLWAALTPAYRVETASNGVEAIKTLEKRNFDLVVTDERMPQCTGTELIRWMREQGLETPVIILTAYGSIESAVEAIKVGAQDYLTKPLSSPEELRLAVQKTLRHQTLRDQNVVHEAETDERFPPDIIAQSAAMKQVLRLASQVAPQTASVLLTGESGTGKEVVARFIHRLSQRSSGPFVAVNCAALTESLLESELFGHEKGAFTGATQAKRGRFELAHGGTLFLDEIAEMGFHLQAQLLRVIQEREFERVGGTRTITVDVRVVSATNRDLKKAIEEKTFREDLFYRLNVFPIHIPPLRERREDIIPLAEHFIARISRRMARYESHLSSEAKNLLFSYDWPGNVRELENGLERALIVAESPEVLAEHLPFQTVPRPSPATASDNQTLADVERQKILEALDANDGDRRRTARQLGISLRKLQYRIKEYGLIGHRHSDRS